MQILAHRGASRAEQENTVAAFRRAAAMGAHAVELDVRRTADRLLVVHHDVVLADGRAIRDVNAANLPSHVPSLATALDACEGMWVNLEIKNDPHEVDFDATESIADDTMELLARRGEPTRWLISSFRMETVDRCRALDPEIGTAWLVLEAPPDVMPTLAAKGHAALHPWVGRLTREVVEECHAAGLHVNTWTCDDPVRILELIDWGVDGVCTNVPDVAIGVLKERERPVAPDEPPPACA